MGYPGIASASPLPMGRGDIDLDAEAELEFQARLDRVLAKMAELGYPVRITEQRRTAERQAELFAQGRTTPGNIVTERDGVNTLSNHQSGLAADLWFTGKDTPWDVLGEVAKAEGLSWGGDWTSLVDRPHVEFNRMRPEAEPPPPPVPTPAQARAGAPRPTPADMLMAEPDLPTADEIQIFGNYSAAPPAPALPPPMAPMRSQRMSVAPPAPAPALAPQQPWDDLFSDPEVQAQLMGGEWEQDAAAATALGGDWEPGPQAAAPPMHPDLAEAEAMGAEVERAPRSFPTKQVGEMTGAFAWKLLKNLVRLPYDVVAAPMIEVGQELLANAGALKGEVQNLLDMAPTKWNTPEFMAEIDRVNKAVGELNPAKVAGTKLWLDPAKQQLAEFTKVTSRPRSDDLMTEVQTAGEALGHLGGAMVPVIGPWVGNAVSNIVGLEKTPTERGEGLADLMTLRLAPKAIDSYGGAYRYVKQHGPSPGPAWNRARAAVTQRLNAQIPPLERPALGVMEALPDKALNYERAVETALGEIKRVEEATGRTVTRIDDFSPALEQAMVENRKMWHDMLDAADATGMRIEIAPFGRTIVTALRELQRLKIEMPPSMIRMLETAERFAQQGHVSPSTAELLLQDLNAALQPVFDAMPSERAALLKNDPSMKGLQAAADQLRTDLYNTMDVVNGKDAAIDLQRRYGHMKQVMSRVNDAWNAARSESAKVQGAEVNPFVIGGQTMTAAAALHLLGTGHVPSGLAGLGIVAGSVAVQHLRGRAARQVREANTVNGRLKQAVAESQPLAQVDWTRPPATTPIPWQRGQDYLPPGPQPLLPPGPGGTPRPPGGGPYTPRPVRTPDEPAGRTFYSGGGGVASSLDPFTMEGEVISPEFAARNRSTGTGPVSTPEQGNYPLPEEQRLGALPGEYADISLLGDLPLTPEARPPAVDMRGGGPSYGEPGFEPPAPMPTGPKRPSPPGRSPAGAAPTPGLTTVSAEMPSGPQAPAEVVAPAGPPLKALSGKVAREALARVRVRLDPKIFKELVQAWKDVTQTKLKGSKWAIEQLTEPLVNWVRTDEARALSESPEYQRVLEQARRAVEDGLPDDYFPPKPPPEPPPPAPVKPPKKPRGPAGGAGAPPVSAAPGGRGSAPRKGRAAREAAQTATEGEGIVKITNADPTVLAHMRDITERQLGAEKWAEEQARFADEGGEPGTVAEMEHLWNALSDHLGVSKEEAAQLLMSGELGRPPERSVPATTKMAPQEPARNPLNVVAKQLLYGIESDSIYAELTEGMSTTSTAGQIAGLLTNKQNSKYHAKAREIGERIIREEAAEREPAPVAPPKSKAAAARQAEAPPSRLSAVTTRMRELQEESLRVITKHRETGRSPVNALKPLNKEYSELQQELTQLHIDANKAKEAGFKAKAEAPAPTPPPKSKAAAAREPAATPKAKGRRVLEVDPARLEYGSSYGEGPKRAEGDIKAAYSADTIAEKGSKVRKPVEIDGQLYTNAGSAHELGSSTEATQLWRLEPKASYKGKSHTYGTDREGRSRGYEGTEVQWKGQTYVLTDPLYVRGTPRTVEAATALVEKVRKALSPEELELLDAEYQDQGRFQGWKEKDAVDPRVVHEAAWMEREAGGGRGYKDTGTDFPMSPRWGRVLDAVDAALGRKAQKRNLAATDEPQVLHTDGDTRTFIQVREGRDGGFHVVTERGGKEIDQTFGHNLAVAKGYAKEQHTSAVKGAAADAKAEAAGQPALLAELRVVQAQKAQMQGVYDKLPKKDRPAYLKKNQPAAQKLRDQERELIATGDRVFGEGWDTKAPPKSKAAAARQAASSRTSPESGVVARQAEAEAGLAKDKAAAALQQNIAEYDKQIEVVQVRINQRYDQLPEGARAENDMAPIRVLEAEKQRLQRRRAALVKQEKAAAPKSKAAAARQARTPEEREAGRQVVAEVRDRRSAEVVTGEQARVEAAVKLWTTYNDLIPRVRAELLEAKAKFTGQEYHNQEIRISTRLSNLIDEQKALVRKLKANGTYEQVRSQVESAPAPAATTFTPTVPVKTGRAGRQSKMQAAVDAAVAKVQASAQQPPPVETPQPAPPPPKAPKVRPIAKGRADRETKAAAKDVEAEAGELVPEAEIKRRADAAADTAEAALRKKDKSPSSWTVSEVRHRAIDTTRKPLELHNERVTKQQERASAVKRTVDLGGAVSAKGVKEALVSDIKAEAKAAPESGTSRVSFHVPGDGTFMTERNATALGNMAQRIEKAGADAFEGIVSKSKKPGPLGPGKMGTPTSSPGTATYLDHAVAELVDAHPDGIGSAEIVETLVKETETKGNMQYHEGDVLRALRRAEAAGQVEHRKGTFQPPSSVRLAVLERDLLKLIPEAGLDGPALKALLEKKYGKEAMVEAESGISGERRQVENALRRLLRAKKIHVEKGKWGRGPNPNAQAMTDYSYIQRPAEKK